MGMYTELNIGVCLKDLPESVIEILKFMTMNNTPCPQTLPYHPLFKTHRWDYMLRCSSGYFDARQHCTLEYDKYFDRWYLTSISNLKNYDGEIGKFLDWIAPYVDTWGFAGYTRYEEAEHPTLIYFNNGSVSLCRWDEHDS